MGIGFGVQGLGGFGFRLYTNSPFRLLFSSPSPTQSALSTYVVQKTVPPTSGDTITILMPRPRHTEKVHKLQGTG